MTGSIALSCVTPAWLVLSLLRTSVETESEKINISGNQLDSCSMVALDRQLIQL